MTDAPESDPTIELAVRLSVALDQIGFAARALDTGEGRALALQAARAGSLSLALFCEYQKGQRGPGTGRRAEALRAAEDVLRDPDAGEHERADCARKLLAAFGMIPQEYPRDDYENEDMPDEVQWAHAHVPEPEEPPR